MFLCMPQRSSTEFSVHRIVMKRKINIVLFTGLRQICTSAMWREGKRKREREKEEEREYVRERGRGEDREGKRKREGEGGERRGTINSKH